MDAWRPLRAQDEASAKEWDGPHEGVPPWLFGPLALWLTHQYPTRAQVVYMRHAAVGEYQRLGMALRLDVTPPGVDQGPDAYERHFRNLAEREPDLLLEAAHHWLGRVYNLWNKEQKPAADALKRLFEESGSVWTVRLIKDPGLERRVSAEQQEAAAAAIARGTRASEYLAVAWREAYDRDPDASASYRDSVRAVEAVTIPMVLPNDRLATLGKVIGELKAHPDRISLRMHTPDAPAGSQAVISMLSTLWDGQYARHAVIDPSQPPNASIEQAQDAVRLAVLIVDWFETRAVTYGDGG